MPCKCKVVRGSDNREIAVFNADSLFSRESAKEKCKSKNGTIITGKVTEGKPIQNGDQVLFLNAENKAAHTDVIAMMEMNHNTVESAGINDDIGICIQNSTEDQLKPLFA